MFQWLTTGFLRHNEEASPRHAFPVFSPPIVTLDWAVHTISHSLYRA